MSPAIDNQAPPSVRERASAANPKGKRLGNLVLKGYLRKVMDGHYEGICLTLNLPVTGRTLEETEKKLNELVIAYLQDAVEHDEWKEFVPRRAPASYYFTYYRYRLLAALHAITDFKLFIESAPKCSAHA